MIIMHKITQCVKKICQKISLLSTFLKSYFSNKFYTKMVKYAPQSSSKVISCSFSSRRLATSSYQVCVFGAIFSLLGRSNIWVTTYALATNVYTNRLSVHSTPCTHNFEQCRQMARSCTIQNSSKCNLEHILVRAIQTQTLRFSQENFMRVFLKGVFNTSFR